MNSRRTARLAEEIREEVAELIAGKLKDPRIGFVTVTRVDLAADLRWARVFVSVLGDEAQKAKSLAGLRQAVGFVRREVGRRIRTRHTPELSFQLDSGIDATERVAQLLDEVKAKEAAARNGEDDDGGD